MKAIYISYAASTKAEQVAKMRVCHHRRVKPRVEEPTRPGAELDDLVDGLAALSRVMVGITARTLATLDVELTLSQYRTMILLVSRGPLRTSDLARAMGVHPSTVTRTCDRLIRRELVARRHGVADRRVSWVTLTESGKDLVGTVMRRRTTEIRQLLLTAGLSDTEAAAEVVNALVTASDEPAEEQWWQRWERSTTTAE